MVSSGLFLYERNKTTPIFFFLCECLIFLAVRGHGTYAVLKSKHNFSVIPNKRYSNKCITIQNCFSHTSWYRIIFCKALVHEFWWQGCNYQRIHINVLINISVTIKMQHCALAIQIHYTRPRKIIPFNNEGSVRRRFCHRRLIYVVEIATQCCFGVTRASDCAQQWETAVQFSSLSFFFFFCLLGSICFGCWDSCGCSSRRVL